MKRNSALSTAAQDFSHTRGYLKRRRHRITKALPYLASGFGILFLMIGAIGTVALQFVLRNQQFDDRSRAAELACNQICGAHADCGLNQGCFQVGSEQRCRLASNPTNSTCSTEAVGAPSPIPSGTASPTPTQSNTPAPSPSPTATTLIQPTPSPIPSPSASPTPAIAAAPTDPAPPNTPVPISELPAERTLLDDFFQMLLDFRPNDFLTSTRVSLSLARQQQTEGYLPLVVFVVGIGLLTYSFGSFAWNKVAHRSTQSSTTDAEPPTAPEAPSTPVQVASPPPLPNLPNSPVPRGNFSYGVHPTPPPGGIPAKKTDQGAHTHASQTQPAQSSPQASTKPPSSMLTRMKEKGVRPPS